MLLKRVQFYNTQIKLRIEDRYEKGDIIMKMGKKPNNKEKNIFLWEKYSIGNLNEFMCYFFIGTHQNLPGLIPCWLWNTFNFPSEIYIRSFTSLAKDQKFHASSWYFSFLSFTILIPQKNFIFILSFVENTIYGEYICIVIGICFCDLDAQKSSFIEKINVKISY